MSRRTWTVEEKLSMVLEMVKGHEAITSLCHRHGVAMSQAYRWRDAFLERGMLVVLMLSDGIIELLRLRTVNVQSGRGRHA